MDTGVGGHSGVPVTQSVDSENITGQGYVTIQNRNMEEKAARVPLKSQKLASWSPVELVSMYWFNASSNRETSVLHVTNLRLAWKWLEPRSDMPWWDVRSTEVKSWEGLSVTHVSRALADTIFSVKWTDWSDVKKTNKQQQNKQNKFKAKSNFVH